MRTLVSLALITVFTCAYGDVLREVDINTGAIKSISHAQPYGFQLDSSIVRAGKVSQRFEIRHGDCGGDKHWDDCDNDRRRVEKFIPIADKYMLDRTVYFGYSIYLPIDFKPVYPSNTTIGQLKLRGYRQPMWDLRLRPDHLLFKADASQQECRVAGFQNMLGTWTDIVVGFDMNPDPDHTGSFDGDFARLWVNGTDTNCKFPRSVITQAMMDKALTSQKSITFNYDWGIYNSYVSRWLDANRTQDPSVTAFTDTHQDSGLVVQSAARDPWRHDWGVQYPTMVIYYDEIRIGYSRESVDVSAQLTPVD